MLTVVDFYQKCILKKVGTANGQQIRVQSESYYNFATLPQAVLKIQNLWQLRQRLLAIIMICYRADKLFFEERHSYKSHIDQRA